MVSHVIPKNTAIVHFFQVPRNQDGARSAILHTRFDRKIRKHLSVNKLIDKYNLALALRKANDIRHYTKI